MTALGLAAVIIVCTAALVGLVLHHRHTERVKILAADVESRLDVLTQRVARAEDRVQSAYDPKAFTELKQQLNTLSLKVGMKVT